jgi:hypothetical protein
MMASSGFAAEKDVLQALSQLKQHIQALETNPTELPHTQMLVPVITETVGLLKAWALELEQVQLHENISEQELLNGLKRLNSLLRAVAENLKDFRTQATLACKIDDHDDAFWKDALSKASAEIADLKKSWSGVPRTSTSASFGTAENLKANLQAQAQEIDDGVESIRIELQSLASEVAAIAESRPTLLERDRFRQLRASNSQKALAELEQARLESEYSWLSWKALQKGALWWLMLSGPAVAQAQSALNTSLLDLSTKTALLNDNLGDPAHFALVSQGVIPVEAMAYPDVAAALDSFRGSELPKAEEILALEDQLNEGRQPQPQELFNATRLYEMAELDGFGYKTSNLMLVSELLRNDKHLARVISPFKAQVPDFVGVPGGDIRDLLRSQIDILDRWHDVVSKSMSAEGKAAAFSDRKLPAPFIDNAKQLAADIEAAFAKLAESPRAVAHPRLIDFLARAKANNWHLMVRSTGKEDTEKLANAGGNLSEGNVSPDLSSILKAIGRVIGSYFKEHSLMQRLAAGDETLFDLPLTPVLIQRMVGEAINGTPDAHAIPTGCVAYTQEPAGRVKAIQVLQCSFGHNAGVVDSLVPLDTIYVRDNKPLQSIIKTKNRRIIPVEEQGVPGLGELSNPPEIQNAASLSDKAAAAIATVSKAIDKYYDKRMDIELAFDPLSQTIFIVQSRPLVDPLVMGTPSYLNAGQLARDRVVHFTTVHPKDSAVRRIQNNKQIVIADTLAQALAIYTDKNFDKSPVIAVVVSRQADATSHAAATFRGEGKLIFLTNEMPQLKKLLAGPNIDVLIDPQQGLAVNLAGDALGKKTERELADQMVIKGGWINYPIPLLVSPGAHQEQICVRPGTPAGIGDRVCAADLKGQVDELQRLTDETREKAYCAGDTLVCLKERLIAGLALPKLENLNTHAHLLMKEGENKPQDVLPELIELFPQRMLDALIGQPERKDLNAYSLKSVKAEIAEREELVEKIFPRIESKTLSPLLLTDAQAFQLVESGAKASLHEEVTSSWIDFVNDVSTRGNGEQKRQLSVLTAALKDLDLLPMWLNSRFAQSLKTSSGWFGSRKKDALKALDSFYDDYFASVGFLEKLAKYKKELRRYDFSKWEDPAKFDEARKGFQEIFSAFFTSEEFLSPDTQLAMMGSLATMGSFADTFDQSIKALKGSTQYQNEQQVQNFKLRLEDYLKVLNKWAPAMRENLIIYHQDWPLARFLTKLNELLSENLSLNVEQKYPSRDFSVAAAALGSVALFERHEPETLEDMFTLIHQSLNTVVGAQMKDVLERTLIVPKEFGALFHVLSGDTEFRADLIGVSISDEGVIYSLSIPLQNHAARIDLIYNKVDQSVVVKFLFLGDARLRWRAIRDYVSLWSSVQQLDYREESLNEQELIFEIANLNKVTAERITKFKNILCGTANSGQLVQAARESLTGNEAMLLRLLERPDSYYRRSALEGFLSLVISGRGPALAITAAARGIQDPEQEVRDIALRLYVNLFLNGVRASGAVEKAFVAAEKEAAVESFSEDPSTQIHAVEIFTQLLRCGRDFDSFSREEASGLTEKIIDVAMKTDHYFGLDWLLDSPLVAERTIRATLVAARGLSGTRALRLYGFLVERGLAFGEAEAEAAKLIATKVDGLTKLLRVEGLRVLEVLVEKNHAFETAEKAILSIIGDYRSGNVVPNRAFELLVKLVEKGHAFENAEREAGAQVLGGDSSYVALKVFRALFEKGRGFATAQRIIAEGKNSSNYVVRDRAHQLARILAEEVRARRDEL